MCFYKDNKGKHRKVKTAGKNIPCFKVLVYTSDNDNNKFISPWKGSMYFNCKICDDKILQKSVTKKSKFRINHEKSYKIEKGLHTYSSVQAALVINIRISIFKAYIPKGTKYYYSSVNHEYVSEKLIVTSKIV